MFTPTPNIPLTSMLRRLDCLTTQLGPARGHGVGLMRGSVEQIEEGLENLKAAIEERGEPFDEMWQWEYRKLHRALSLLREYCSFSPQSADDDLADVLGDYVRYALNHSGRPNHEDRCQAETRKRRCKETIM